MYKINMYPGWIPMIKDKRNLNLNYNYISAITNRTYGEDYNPNHIYTGYVINNSLITTVIIDDKYVEIFIPLEDISQYIILEYFKKISKNKSKVKGRLINEYIPEKNTSDKTFIEQLVEILNIPS